MNYLRFNQTKSRSYPVVRAREGEANTTPFQVAHFALRNTLKNGGEKEAEQSSAEVALRAKKAEFESVCHASRGEKEMFWCLELRVRLSVAKSKTWFCLCFAQRISALPSGCSPLI